MTKPDKDILLAKIDTLQYSIADVQLQSVVILLRDLVNSLEINDSQELGFSTKKTT